MIAKVPEKRTDGGSSFLQLIAYATLRDELKMDEALSPETPCVRKSRSEAAVYSELMAYAARNPLPDSDDVIATFDDGRQRVQCGNVVAETNCFSLATASAEMNMVARQNRRCKDPIYHFILSWPPDERPSADEIFDSARYCMTRLGAEGQQYVLAIHDDTNKLHCHVAMNRIHPVSHKALEMYNNYFKLDRCCRELELKYGWQHVKGPYMVNDQGNVVRRRKFYQPAPAEAKKLEHFGDRESLFSYAVEHCRDRLKTLFLEPHYRWDDVHDVLVAAGLELRRKGPGLAIYDLCDDTQRPVKASSIHPELTLDFQQEVIGAFSPASVVRDVNRDGEEVLLSAVNIDSQYDNRLHRRDKGGRAERRNARAESRENLMARYQAYKTGFVRPGISAGEVRTRYKELAAGYRIRKNNVRLSQRDPLLRKLTYRALEVEKMKDMAALRLQLQDERKALKARPDSRPLPYRAWVEVQATQHDAAAISQLRGWAYREKKNNRTPVISNNFMLYGAADDTRPSKIRGYDTHVNRDGAVVYSSEGQPVLLDRGVLLEVADVPDDKGKNLAMALHMSAERSGERVEIRGDKAFVLSTAQRISHFNATSGKRVGLTHPVQRQLAGYDRPNVPPVAPKPEPEQKRPAPRQSPGPKP
jgi:hypothetical protein